MKFSFIIQLLIYIYFGLFFINNCNSKTFDNDDLKKIYSIIKVNIIYNNNTLNDYSSSSCELEFRDDLNNKIEYKKNNFSNFIIIESNPGKIFLRKIICHRKNLPFFFGRYRTKFINEQGFVAHQDFINYAGELTISFNSSLLLFSDFFNLSSLSTDFDGIVGFRTDFSPIEAVNFIKNSIPNPANLKIAKSLFGDNHYLEPNKDPEIVEINQPIIDSKSNQMMPKIIEIGQDQIPYQNIYKDISDQQTNNFEKNDMPSHPYLAPNYSEFYSPNYNQYYSIGGNISNNKNIYLDIQDPVQEKPWFDPVLNKIY